MKVQRLIETKLTEALSPVHLDIQNESYMHSVPDGSESHFKVVIVSEAFAGQMPVKRHQQVYQILADELQVGGVHALALHTYTSSEWEQLNREVPRSPNCMGGSKNG